MTAATGRQIYIGTHHKTGTVLMLRIFNKLAKRTGLVLHNFARAASDGTPPAHADILFDNHSQHIESPLVDEGAVRGIHLIRDPRMVVISATRYHLTSDEPWLHAPDPRFGGKTYQQHLQSLATDRERYLFEMDEHHHLESAGRTLLEMQRISSELPAWCIDVKLEGLMQDTGFTRYREVFTHLHLTDRETAMSLITAANNSAFQPDFESEHARSGKVEDWRSYFDDALEAQFKARFGTIADDLGY